MDTHSFQPAPLLNKNSSRSRNSLALAGGFLVTGLLGAGQLLMLVFIAGEGPAADALLAAYAIYNPFALFGIFAAPNAHLTRLLHQAGAAPVVGAAELCAWAGILGVVEARRTNSGGSP